MSDVHVTLHDTSDGEPKKIGEWITDRDGQHHPVDAPLTFDEVSNANRARAERWHPGYPYDDEWTGADWSNAMCGEAGEAANVVKKLRRYECGLRGELDPTEAELRAALAEEIADVFLYADLLATKYGIDIPAAVIAKFNKVSERQGFPERLRPEAAT